METWKLAALLSLIAIGKNGIQRSDAVSSYIEHTSTIDDFNTYFRTSPVLLFVSRTFDISNETQWLMVHVVATCVFLIALFIVIRRDGVSRGRLLMVSIILGPPVTLVLTEVGRYDVFFLMGALGVAFGGPIVGPLSASLMFFSDFEQALVVALCVVVMSFATELNFPRRNVLRSLVFGGMVSTLVVWLVLGSQEAHDSRWNALWRNLEGAVLANLRSLPLLVFGSLGVMWLPYITTLSLVRERTTVFLITMGSFGLPMLLTLTTLDGTRVFTCISFLPLLILFRNWDYPKKLVESRSTLLLLLAVGLFSPSLNVYVDGLVKAPYEEIYQFFRN